MEAWQGQGRGEALEREHMKWNWSAMEMKKPVWRYLLQRMSSKAV